MMKMKLVCKECGATSKGEFKIDLRWWVCPFCDAVNHMVICPDKKKEKKTLLAKATLKRESGTVKIHGTTQGEYVWEDALNKPGKLTFEWEE